MPNDQNPKGLLRQLEDGQIELIAQLKELLRTALAVNDERDRLRAEVDRIAGQACAAEIAWFAEKRRSRELIQSLEKIAYSAQGDTAPILRGYAQDAISRAGTTCKE